jgi:hypothetical protein
MDFERIAAKRKLQKDLKKIIPLKYERYPKPAANRKKQMECLKEF